MNDIEALPTTYNYTEYFSFISKYGTHYVRNATFGGRISAYTTVSFFTRGILRNNSVDTANGLRTMVRLDFGLNETVNADYTLLLSKGVTVKTYRTYI